MPEANPYLETLQSESATGAAPGNPYLDLLQSGERMRKTQTAAAVSLAVGTSPEEYARRKRVAEFLGYPPAAVDAMPDLAKKQAREKQVQQDIAEHPVLQRRFSDEDFARLAHDDTGTLSVLANSVKRGWSGLQELVPGAAFRANSNALKNFDEVEAKLAAGEVVLDTQDPMGLRFMTPEQRQQQKALFIEKTAVAATKVAGLEAQKRTYPQPEVAQRVAQAQTFGGAVREFLTDPVKYVASIGPESVVQSAPSLVLGGLAGRVGGMAAGAAAAGGGSFVTDYNGALLEALGRAGVDVTNPEALAAAASDQKLMQSVASQAFAHATMVGAFDAVSAGAASRVALPAGTLAARPMARELANLGVQIPVQGGLGGAGELGGQVVAGQDIEPGAVLAEIVGEGFGAPAEVAAMALGQVHQRMQQAKAEADLKALQEVLKQATESATRERAPESFAALMQEMADASPDAPKQVRFDARTLLETLQQSGLEQAELEQMLPSVMPQLDEAVAVGGEVVVPLGEFSKVAGTDLEQPLLQNARIGDNELSQAESKQAGEQAAALIQQQAEQVLRQAGDSAAARVEAETVRTAVLDQLNTAGRFRADVNEAYATLVRDFYVTMAGRLKTTPDALYAQYPLTVRAEGVGGFEQFGGVRAQHAPRGLLKQAERLLEAGEDAETVRQKTGWHRGAEGMWRFEISDDEARLNAETWQDGGTVEGRPVRKLEGPLFGENGVFLHDDLLSNYPELADLKVEILESDGLPFKISAAYDSKARTIEVWVNPAKGGDPLSALLHEVQHAVQAIEGFTRGGSSAEAKYQALAGEVEARNTQARQFMNASERRATSPESTADVPLADQVLRQDADGKEAKKPPPRGTFNPAALNITLLQDADLSTFLHESGHLFLDLLWRFASDPQAPADVQTDMAAVLKWFKTTPEQWAAWTEDYNATGKVPAGMRKQHERFAEGFEQYLLEGKAPSLELQPLFSKFRSWLLNVYKSLKDFLAGRGEAAGPAGELGQGPAEDAIRKAWSEAKGVVLGKPTPITVEFNGRKVNFMARQDQLARGKVQSTIHLTTVKRGRLLKGDPEGWVSVGYKLDGKNNLVPEGLPKRLTDEDAAQFNASFTPAGEAGAMGQANQKTPLGLTDEVRGVFDRLLASQEQIAQAELLRGFGPLTVPGMQPAERVAYEAQGQKATDTALDKLASRSVKDMRWTTNARSRALKALQQDAAAKRKVVEAEVAAEVAQQPIRQAMRWLRKGEMVTAEGEQIRAEKGFRLNTAALAEMYPDSMLARPDLERLKGMTAGNGLHPDVVAGMFGFTSGDELVRALIDAEPTASVVEGMTDQRMLERFGDLATEHGMQRAADEAVHNEARGRFIATGLKALQDAQGEREQTPRGGSVNVMVRAAKSFALQLIARRKVRDLKPGQHTAAEARAGKAAMAAAAKNDTQAAIVAQRDALLNHYAARETYAALDEVDRALVYLRKFAKDSVRKGLPPEYLDQIDKLLERVDLRTSTTLGQIDKRAKLADWIKAQADMGVEVELPAEVLEDARLTSYKDLPLETFRGLVDTVKQVEHLGRLKDKLLTAKDERTFAAVQERIVSSILANGQGRVADTRTPRTNLGRAWASVRKFGAAHIKVATLARIMDGGKDGGPVWEYFVRSANERSDQETTMLAKATKDLSAIMTPLIARGRLGGAGQFFPSIRQSLNREAVLAIALNIGNKSNLQRLLGGEGWTPEQIQPVLDTLTPDDWAAVQKVWDYFETFRPLIGAKELRVRGKAPDWIEPGSTLADRYKVKGGYYPVKYDPAASQRAEEHADAEGARRQLQGAYGAATTRRSFTKARAEEVVGRPLLYTLQGVYSGVTDVIHDLAWHEWLIDVNRLLRAKGIDSAIRETYGPDAVRQFKAWRDDIAEGNVASDRAMDMALGYLRQSVSVAGLGFNVVSAMMQPLGLFQSWQRIGLPWLARGIQRTVGRPVAASREVNAKSSFMTNRARTRFRELNELRNRVQGQNPVQRVVSENAFRLMVAFQRLVDVPTWVGAYEKAIADGNGEARAVVLADQAVIDAQGGGQVKDLAAIERGPQALKLFTVFYSFMNTALNLGVASAMTPRSRGKLAADMLLLFVLPAVLGSALKDALTPGDAGDDDEELAKKLAGEQLSYLLGLVVLGREFGQAARMVTGADAHDYTGPAGLRAVADVYQFTKQASQGEFDDAFRKATVNLAGDFLGLPSAQINRSITGAQALGEGKTQNPAALLTGYQEPR